jgi:type I restriction enzyme S subunit
VKDWVPIRIRDLIEASCPGDWGTEGSPEDGVAVLRSTNFRNDGSINYSDLAFRKIDQSRLNKRRVVEGTILIEKSGGSDTQAAGRVVYCDLDFNGSASNFIEIVTVKDRFCPRYAGYLLYYLYHSGLVSKYQQQTTGIINFKVKEYFDEFISCPEFKPEQSKIAEVLSTVDLAIGHTEEVIAKQQRIKIGLMRDLLGRGLDEKGRLRSEATHGFKNTPAGRIPAEWDPSTLEEVGEWMSGGTPSKSNPAYWGDEVPWVCPKDMKMFDLTSTTHRLTRAGVRHGSREVPASSVFIVVRGMILAHTFPVSISSIPMAFNQDVKAIVACPDDIEPRFLAYWFVSNGSKLLKMTTTATHGTKRFDMKELFDVPIALPKKPEQTRIVKRLDAAEMEIANNRKTAAKLRSLIEH